MAMLYFDELQEFPKMSSWATKSDFICDIMGTQNLCTFPDLRVVILATGLQPAFIYIVVESI